MQGHPEVITYFKELLRGELAARCEDLHQRWGLPTAKWVRGFKPLAA